MAIDTEAIKVHVRGILEALGDDPDREGLKETPDRVARMYELRKCLIKHLPIVWNLDRLPEIW